MSVEVPGGHILSSAQMVPEPSLKVPAAQGAHCRFELTVGSAVWRYPTGQAARASKHSGVLSSVLKVTPGLQARQTRSAIGVGIAPILWPALQFVHTLQGPVPPPRLNCPVGHASQTRFEVGVGAALCADPGLQPPTGLTATHDGWFGLVL